MSDRTKQAARLVTPLSFPSTRDVLWDHAPQGDSFRLTATEGRCIRVRLAEQALVLAADCAVDVPRQCCLYGRASVRADGQEVLLDVSHFDCSHDSNCQHGDLAPPAQSSLTVPLTVSKLAARLQDDELRMHMETSLMLLRSRATAHKSIDVADFLPLRAYAYFSSPSAGMLEAEVTFDLAVHGSAFLVTPVAAVPVADTALSVSLIRDRDVLGDAPRSGFLTMDQTRKLVFMLESDPKAFTLPLVGLWVKGIDVITHPYVWAACMRYLFDAAIGDRACGTPSTGRQAFLVLLIPPAAGSRPRFFDCSLTEDATDGHLASGKTGAASSEQRWVYDLLSSTMGHSFSKARGLGPTRAAMCLDLCPVRDGPRSAPFAAAVASFSDAAPAVPRTCVESITADELRRRTAGTAAPTLPVLSRLHGTEDDTVPRASPSPHLRKTIASSIAPSVPDVSLIFDDGLPSPSNDVGARCELPPASARGPAATATESASRALVTLKRGSPQETACCSPSWQQQQWPAPPCPSTNGYGSASAPSKRVAFSLPKRGAGELSPTPAADRGSRPASDDGDEACEQAIIAQQQEQQQQQELLSCGHRLSLSPAERLPYIGSALLPRRFPGDQADEANPIVRQVSSHSRTVATDIKDHSALPTPALTSARSNGELARLAVQRRLVPAAASTASDADDCGEGSLPIVVAKSTTSSAGGDAQPPSPDVYELLRRQDEQLRVLQEQIGRLLRSQRPGGPTPVGRSAKSAGDGRSSTEPSKSPRQCAVSPIESPPATLVPASVVVVAEPRGAGVGDSKWLAASSRSCDARGIDRSAAGIAAAAAQSSSCSVAVNTGTSLYCAGHCSPVPVAGQRPVPSDASTAAIAFTRISAHGMLQPVSCHNDARDRDSSVEGEVQSDDGSGCDLDSLSAVSELQVPPQASFASSSSIVLDMPSYASTSYRSRVTSEGEQSDSSGSSSNNRRVASKHSQQMAAARQELLSSPTGHQHQAEPLRKTLCIDKEPEGPAEANYYGALIKNVRDLLARHEASGSATAVQPPPPPQSSAQRRQEPPQPELRSHRDSLRPAGSAGLEAAAAETGAVASSTATADALSGGQLRRSQAAVSADVATEARSRAAEPGVTLSSRSPASPAMLVSALLPRAEYESLFLSADDDDDEVHLSPDKSMEVNALALKYLGDRQLTRLARLAGAATAAAAAAVATPSLALLASAANSAMSPLLMLQAVLPQAGSGGGLSLLDTSAASTNNWMSFASAKYLKRHGLLGSDDRRQPIVTPMNGSAPPTAVQACDTASCQKCHGDNCLPTAGKSCADALSDGETAGNLLRMHPASYRHDMQTSGCSSLPKPPVAAPCADATPNSDVQVLAGLTKAPRRLRSQLPLAAIDINRPAAESGDRRLVATVPAQKHYEPVKVLDMDRLRELPKLL